MFWKLLCIFIMFFFKFFNYSLHSTLFWMSFRCAVDWLDNHILYKVILPIFPVLTWHRTRLLHYWLYSLCCTLHPVTIIITGNLYFLIPFTFQTHSLNPPTTGKHQFVLCIYEFVSVSFVHLFCFKIPHISKMIYHLSFSFWVISLIVIPSRFIHVVAKDKISFLLIIE